MKNKLFKLLQYLTPDQLSKEVIDLDFNDELKEIIGEQKISISTSGKTKKIFLAGFGTTEDYQGTIDLVYKNRQGKLVVKPKLIQEFIESEE